MKVTVMCSVKSTNNWSHKEKAVFDLELKNHRLNGSARLIDDICHQNEIGGVDDCIGKGSPDADKIARIVKRWNGKHVPALVEEEIMQYIV